MRFPGLGKYAALGSILAARANNLAAQNQSQQGPNYIAPTVGSQFMPVKGPENALKAGQAPELPQQGDITLPPMPASSMLRDVAARPQGQTSMANFIANNNRKYRGLA